MKLELLERLYPLNRSLICDDTDKAFKIIQEYLPLEIGSVPSGQKVFTWTVPKRWKVNHARLTDSKGQVIADFTEHPLHLVSYSTSFKGQLTKKELKDRIFTNPKRPNDIPFYYKYYENFWGFCLKHSVWERIGEDEVLHVDIDTELTEDALKYGECTIQGESDETILLVCNICHPFQVNDSISGLVTLVSLMRKLMGQKVKHTIKLLICPETIGSLCYFHNNLKNLPHYKFGIFAEMLGGSGKLIFMNSPFSNTKIDRAGRYVMKRNHRDYEICSYMDAPCNDDKVLNSPGIAIPTACLLRWPYPEYHTSADTPQIISEPQLDEIEKTIEDMIMILDQDYIPIRHYDALLSLQAYDLSDKFGALSIWDVYQTLMELDNKQTVFDIAEKHNISFVALSLFLDHLIEKRLINKKFANSLANP